MKFGRICRVRLDRTVFHDEGLLIVVVEPLGCSYLSVGGLAGSYTSLGCDVNGVTV